MTDQNIILSTIEKQENNNNEATPRSSPDVESQIIPDDGFFAHISTHFTTHLQEPVCSTSHFLEAELLILSFATGILDGVSFPEFSCFTSRQNGNTVLFAIAALKIPTRGSEALVDASHAAIALSMFSAAVLLQGQAANWLGCGIGSWSGGDRFLQHSRGYKTYTIDAGVIGVVFRHASRSRPWTGSQRYHYGDGDG
ncbi:hypothetical protein D6D21_04547 [Aureobasidium pullulans]|uniref:DUF1275 domain protein n=1 Tax=Aureobasidium pullulans TaxID=5580 RepID=A0AB74IYI3_AURPU|nr:hypothetical protein D6D21_04547 [Aureobasidium pullulans]